RFQLGQPLLGQSKASAQLCRRLDRGRELVDALGLCALNARTAVFLTAREDPTRDCASEYRLAAACQPRCLPNCRHVTLICARIFKSVAVRYETRFAFDRAHEIVNEWCMRTRGQRATLAYDSLSAGNYRCGSRASQGSADCA